MLWGESQLSSCFIQTLGHFLPLTLGCWNAQTLYGHQELLHLSIFIDFYQLRSFSLEQADDTSDSQNFIGLYLLNHSMQRSYVYYFRLLLCFRWIRTRYVNYCEQLVCFRWNRMIYVYNNFGCCFVFTKLDPDMFTIVGCCFFDEIFDMVITTVFCIFYRWTRSIYSYVYYNMYVLFSNEICLLLLLLYLMFCFWWIERVHPLLYAAVLFVMRSNGICLLLYVSDVLFLMNRTRYVNVGCCLVLK